LTKDSWLNLLPFGKMSSAIGLRPVEKNINILSFVPMACHVLGMTSLGYRPNIFGNVGILEPGLVIYCDFLKKVLFWLV
jgi:hypothetical protein